MQVKGIKIQNKFAFLTNRNFFSPFKGPPVTHHGRGRAKNNKSNQITLFIHFSLYLYSFSGAIARLHKERK